MSSPRRWSSASARSYISHSPERKEASDLAFGLAPERVDAVDCPERSQRSESGGDPHDHRSLAKSETRERERRRDEHGASPSLTGLPGKAGVTPAAARRLVLALPGVEEGTSYGMPSFKVAGKFFARLRDDDSVLVIHLRSFEERDRLLENEAAAFFTTDHYRNYPTVLLRLARVKKSCWPRCWRMRGVVPRRAVWSRNTTPAEQPDLVSNAVQWSRSTPMIQIGRASCR